VDTVFVRQRVFEVRVCGFFRGLAVAEVPPVRIVADLAAAIPAGVRLERLLIDYAREGAVEMEVAPRRGVVGPARAAGGCFFALRGPAGTGGARG
jgi:hypothetical protein